MFFVLCLVIEGCTTINLSPKLLFNQSKYRQFPELQDGLKWNGFSMNRITQSSNSEISYFPKNNFFLILNSNKAGHFNPIKIDNVGNKVFELDITEKTSSKLSIEMINCFVITKDSIYDLSVSNPVATPFLSVLNKENDFSKKDWVETFGRFYNVSDIVLYSYHSDIPSAMVVYFQNQGKWIKLYTSVNDRFIYSGTGSEVVCEINDEKIPHKWYEAHYLKDIKKATYSNVHRYTDSYINPYDTSFFPDQTLEYSSAGNLNTLTFSKETYTDEGYYNLGIPVRFYGTGYYALDIENSILNFKTVAEKDAFAGKEETNLHLFWLPTQYTNKSNVRFLTYDYGTNYHENGKKGVYVIKRI